MNTRPSYWSLPTLALACLALLGLAACDGGGALLPADLADPVQARSTAPPPRPLKGQLTGISMLSPEGRCEGVAGYPLTATLELTGTLSHLGRVMWTSTDCTSIAGFPEITFIDGTGVITAANGDELYFTYAGSALVGPNLVAKFTGEATIAGGTGRFSNASGTFDLSGTLGLTDSVVEMQVDGWISYNASDHGGV